MSALLLPGTLRNQCHKKWSPKGARENFVDSLILGSVVHFWVHQLGPFIWVIILLIRSTTAVGLSTRGCGRGIWNYRDHGRAIFNQKVFFWWTHLINTAHNLQRELITQSHIYVCLCVCVDTRGMLKAHTLLYSLINSLFLLLDKCRPFFSGKSQISKIKKKKNQLIHNITTLPSFP